MFKDIEAGRKIFVGWVRKFGAVDQNDTIGLTLVTGVDREHPDRYRLAVSYRDADVLDSGVRFLGFSVRFHEMNPRDSHNLGQFLKRYQRLGRYRIAPMERRAADHIVQTTHPGISIEKRVLKIVPAWTIGPRRFPARCIAGDIEPRRPERRGGSPVPSPVDGRASRIRRWQLKRVQCGGAFGCRDDYPPRERAAAAHGDTQPVMILQVARQGLADIPVIIGHGNDGDASIANG